MKNFWLSLQRPFTVLAPMEDVTDTVFRRIVKSCGAPDVFFTEFMSTDGYMSPGKDRVARRIEYTEEERPLVAQIWGNKPEKYYQTAQELVKLGFDGIDINMGCPVHKIVKKGCCSALADNPTLAGEIIQACKEGAKDIPVSVKTRLGYRTKKTEEWSKFLLEQDIAVLTMHGRTQKEMSKVPADWSEIKKVVDIRNEMGIETLIIGNGDVKSLEEVHEKHTTTGVDGVMIGRGIFTDPYVFNPDKSIMNLTIEERLDLLLRHTRLFNEIWGDVKNFALLKKFFKIYVSDFEGAVELRVELMKCDSLAQVEEVVANYAQ
ncbi:tRNA-dihydrouridine synthase [Candidatus Dojkabacteria bacterium]|uniref:tRNA-dihydrouridine synthase n=1 Tax=Candidatus Dojkabacteria bacterium TaxID=2099670 RepID=A0A955L794_9BACT|nr:tRNA-dihydrouridine synthase [Candidatus Dojkabacteria bacterium]